MNNPYDGKIIAINKPAGISSFDVVRRIRKAVNIRKVGHGGTLDPFAEGVLIIGIGRSATRRLGEFLKGDKEYIAEVILGIVTDTYDPTGKVLECNPVPDEDKEALEKRIATVLENYKGEIQQVPPTYSAIKINGVRSYKAARQGKELEIEARKVTIAKIEMTRLTEKGFEMRVVCSHGTYIRSLGYDIGRQLGYGAHLGKLIRTRVGDFTIDEAINMDEFLKNSIIEESSIWK
ncbi:tRNA pseudouridine(55) synthase TruB [bacterium]|nr:tRNA pseudouridine(55) synthase TruB [bacterium]